MNSATSLCESSISMGVSFQLRTREGFRVPWSVREDNDLITKTDRGTPMGELFRRFWIPALLAEELPGTDCNPVRVRIMG
jgi:hypothetical protein